MPFGDMFKICIWLFMRAIITTALRAHLHIFPQMVVCLGSFNIGKWARGEQNCVIL